ncbi:MAG: hypothetical protein AUK48_15620 [Oscillatoriales cyanobacterium CG2_30_44_21]|nr:MAG: hypothetical protein AUK48_15620 [Oscillatoriales cyanobacterium CG2_30_44_21]
MSEEVQQERVDFWQEIKDVAPESLIFIDESALWEGMERPVARSPKGRKAFSLRRKMRIRQSRLPLTDRTSHEVVFGTSEPVAFQI